MSNNKLEKREYVCIKCGSKEFNSDVMQATGGNFAKLFDIQNKKFTMITCASCGYTELYRDIDETGMNVLDFLFQ
ncbi:zinc ribbon domain-containing protein [Erysipelotrichaceae bacterium OttesenSCG-928-M19]|nr:zinc ribbon domain-containing protein [Erysipelotrichaceae bacterium OttesenSCG-928-M19]